jgi:hypothetical protein
MSATAANNANFFLLYYYIVCITSSFYISIFNKAYAKSLCIDEC